MCHSVAVDRCGEPLSVADEVNLLLEHSDAVYVVSVVGLLGPGGVVTSDGDIDLEALRSRIATRLDKASRLSCVLSGPPGRRRLVRVSPDLTAHVRSVQPGAEFDLARWCAGVAGQRLPLDRPLWEVLVVPKALGSSAAVLFRLHHALADGATAVRILGDLLDPTEPEPRPPRRHGETGGGWRGPPLLGDLARRLPATKLLGALGQDRRLALLTAPQSVVSARARSAGGTLNAALLASIGQGAIAAFCAIGEQPPHELPVSVPVLLPSADDTTNQVSAVVIRVPLAAMTLPERIRAVSVASAKVRAARTRPLPVFARTLPAARLMDWYLRRQRMVALHSTNVRGPASPRRLAGAPLDSIWPIPILGSNVRIGAAMVSYAGRLCFGLSWSTEIDGAGVAFAREFETAIRDLGTSQPPESQFRTGSTPSGR